MARSVYQELLAVSNYVCGLCGKRIPKKDPAVYIRWPYVERKREVISVGYYHAVQCAPAMKEVLTYAEEQLKRTQRKQRILEDARRKQEDQRRAHEEARRRIEDLRRRREDAETQ